MAQYDSLPITQLPVASSVLSTDVYPGVDTVDLDESPSGTTKKYTIAQLQTYMALALTGSGIDSVKASSTANYLASYDNGTSGVGATLTNIDVNAAFVADGVTLAVGDRVLIKNQSVQYENGIYTVTVAGSVATPWILTRATDYNGSTRSIEYGDYVGVIQGTANALTFWFQTHASPIVIGTTSIVFAEETSGAIESISNLGAGAGIYAGNVGTDAQLKSLTAGSNVVITPSSTEILIAAASGGLTWSTIAGTSQSAVDGNGYITSNVALTTITLPAICAVGGTVGLIGRGTGGWKMAANAGQTIQFGSTATSVAGSLSSTDDNDTIYVVCIVANTTWAVLPGPISAGLTVL